MPDIPGISDLDKPLVDGPSCPHCGSFLVLPDGTCGACAAQVDLQDEPGIVVPEATSEEGIVKGWRSWSLDVTSIGPDRPLLRSVTHSEVVWPPREEVVARCRKTPGPTGSGRPSSEAHPIPVPDCDCGLYAARTRKHLLSMSYHTYDGELDGMYCVIGLVLMWGNVIPGTQGWRAEKAYPHKLYVPFEAYKYARALKETYGVKVKLDNFLGTHYRDKV
jgi:hypothetical protein